MEPARSSVIAPIYATPAQLGFHGVPLYLGGRPSPDDVRQHDGDDCMYLSALSAVAALRPSSITSRIKPLGNNIFAVTLAGKEHRIDASFPVYPTVDGYKSVCGDFGNVLWVALMEKAWAATRPRGWEDLSGANFFEDTSNSVVPFMEAVTGLPAGRPTRQSPGFFLGDQSGWNWIPPEPGDPRKSAPGAYEIMVMANRNRRPLVCDFSGWFGRYYERLASTGLGTGHAYFLRGCDTARRLVYMGDPRGREFDPKPVRAADISLFTGSILLG